MTRLPLEVRNVVGVEGPEYPLNAICAKPGCLSPSEQGGHHLWRRSELIGAWWWVYIPDDDVRVGNVVGLCQLHHHAVTVNSAWIKWENGQYEWSDMIEASQPLTFQPPVRLESNEESLPNGPEKNGEDPVHTFDGSCPTCHRPLPHTKAPPEAKRPRRTWSITVPVDERENGAEALTTLLEEGRKEMAKAGLPYGADDSANYFVLATMLGLFVQHADEILSDS